ncbi:hypothetical protein P8452_59685 [Trifolium repens]|nr:hypothetical protein P8452_59685 [Trifolium repens]
MANVKHCMWPPEKQCVRIKFHHKGQLVTKSVHCYINGVVDERDWNWNVDMLSYMEIDGLVKSLGYASVKCLWYCDPRLSFSQGLRPLNK